MEDFSNIFDNINSYAETLDHKVQELMDESERFRKENANLKNLVSTSKTEISELLQINKTLVERLNEAQEEYLREYNNSLEKSRILNNHTQLHKKSIKLITNITKKDEL